MRAGFWAQCHRRCAGELAQPVPELGQKRERARNRRERLQRMDVGKAGKPRHLLIEARVVLHGAGAERKHAGVDAVVLAREPHVMAQSFGLRQSGKSDPGSALEQT